MRRLGLLSLALGLLAVPTAFADLAPRPNPRPGPGIAGREADMTIEIDANLKKPKLVISPQALLNRPGGVFGGVRGGDGAAPPADEPKPDQANADGATETRTLVAGFAMAMAVSMGGLWLVRRQGKIGTKSLALLAVGGSLVIGTLVYANAPPPVRPQPPVPVPPQPQASLFDGKVDIEVDRQAKGIKLLLDPATARKMLQQGQPRPVPRDPGPGRLQPAVRPLKPAAVQPFPEPKSAPPPEQGPEPGK